MNEIDNRVPQLQQQAQSTLSMRGSAWLCSTMKWGKKKFKTVSRCKFSKFVSCSFSRRVWKLLKYEKHLFFLQNWKEYVNEDGLHLAKAGGELLASQLIPRLEILTPHCAEIFPNWSEVDNDDHLRFFKSYIE